MCSIALSNYMSCSIKKMLVRPKDQDLKEKESGVIYSYQCEAICDRSTFSGVAQVH